MRIETLAVHAGYTPEPTTKSAAVPLYQTVGTTMLVILPIAALGSLGFLAAGHLDLTLFVQVLAGQIIGAYVGAKFTRMAPQLLLKSCMVLLPALGGIILLLAR